MSKHSLQTRFRR